MTFLMIVICDIAIYADHTTLYYKCNNLNWLLNLNVKSETLWTGSRSALLISGLGKLNWFNNTGSIDVKMDGSVFDENSSFKMLVLTFSSKLYWLLHYL